MRRAAGHGILQGLLGQYRTRRDGLQEVFTEDVLELELELLQDVWAWKDAEPRHARRMAQLWGTLRLQREALEAIAADADPTSERIARDALQLHDGSIPRMLPEVLPDLDLDALGEAGTPELAPTLRERVLAGAARHAGHSPLARRLLEEDR